LMPGQSFTGKVARISNSLDKNTRTMPVELNFINPTFQILPGMFCKVTWPTRREQKSLFVPDSAVVSTPLDTFVCRVNNDRIEWVSIRKGQTMDRLVEIFGPINEGDIVALQGSEELQNQSRVNPVLVK
jgi:membrane fusion protein (multidrug efflux system)